MLWNHIVLGLNSDLDTSNVTLISIVTMLRDSSIFGR